MEKNSACFLQYFRGFTVQDLTHKVTSFLQKYITKVHGLKYNLIQLCTIFLNFSCELWRGINQYGIKLAISKLQADIGSNLLL